MAVTIQIFESKRKKGRKREKKEDRAIIILRDKRNIRSPYTRQM